MIIQQLIGKSRRIYRPSVDGNYYPSKSTNSLLSKWLSFSFGLFPHWGLATYTGSEAYYTNVNSDVPAPSVFTPPSDINSKIEAWVDYAKDVIGADYITLTAKHNYGFCLFPTTAQFNGGVQVTAYDETRETNITRPFYEPYAVNHPSIVGSVSQTMIETFVNRCRQKNIEPVLYYNLGKSLNIDFAHTRPASAFDESGNYGDYYADWYANGYASANNNYPTLTGTYAEHYRKQIDFNKAQLTELINLTDCKYFWFDSPYTYPRAHIQEVFNHVKAIRDIIVITNNLPIPLPNGSIIPTGSIPAEPIYNFNGDLYLFPSDVSSVEHSFDPGDSNELGLTLKPWRGQDYYIPGELTTNSGTTFFWKSGFAMKSQVALQEVYDLAVSQNIPCSLSLSPDTSGNLNNTQKTRLEGIVR